MADVTLFSHKVTRVALSPQLHGNKVKDTAVVELYEGAGLTQIYVAGWDPAAVSRARSIANALLTAADLVVDAQRRAAAVPIESLAPSEWAEWAEARR